MDSARPDGQRRLLLAGALTAVGLALVLVALTARTAPAAIIYQIPRVGYGTPPPPSPGAAPSGAAGTVGSPNPFLDVLFQILVAAAVLGGIALISGLAIIVIRSRGAGAALVANEESSEPVTVDPTAIDDHLSRSAAALELDGDVNTTVLRCWEGLEQLVEHAGAVRDPAQTARDFTRTVLRRASLPVGAIDRLADLYEAALFSGDSLPESARADAIRCLQQLRAAVRPELVQ